LASGVRQKKKAQVQTSLTDANSGIFHMQVFGYKLLSSPFSPDHPQSGKTDVALPKPPLPRDLLEKLSDKKDKNDKSELSDKNGQSDKAQKNKSLDSFKWSHDSVAALREFADSEINNQGSKGVTQYRDQAASAGPGNNEKFTQILEQVYGVSGVKKYSLSFSLDARSESSSSQTQKLSAYAASNQRGSGLSYDYSENFREQESVKMAMSGQFTTDDGKTFAFSINYSRERVIEQSRNFSLRVGDAVKNTTLRLPTVEIKPPTVDSLMPKPRDHYFPEWLKANEAPALSMQWMNLLAPNKVRPA
jgi:hypothetical protein